MTEAIFVDCPHCGKEGIKEGYEGERCIFCKEFLEPGGKAVGRRVGSDLIAVGGCPDCGGDLEWIPWDFKRVWKCRKCGRILSEEERLSPPARESGKRKYTKGEKFFAKYPSSRPKVETGSSSKTVCTQVIIESPDYWRGYRQAVLDGAPKVGGDRWKS